MIKIAALLYIMQSAFTAFEHQGGSPAQQFQFNRAVVSASTPGSVTNPAYLPRLKYPFIHFSGSRIFDLKDLYSSYLKIGYGNGLVGFQATWKRFGIDEYMENIAEADFGFMPVQYISFGIGFNYYNLSINTREISLHEHLCDGKLSILIEPFSWLALSFQQDNITSLFIKKRQDLLFPQWSTGISIKPIRGLSLMWNINSTPTGYVNSIAAAVNIMKYLIVNVGYARELTTFSASLTLLYKYVSVSYGLRYHTHLGFTHSIGLTVTTKDMDIECLNFQNPSLNRNRNRKKKIKKININTCTESELLTIPVLTGTLARRIIKYRKIIGPVSRKSLVQIGMTGKDINELLEYVYGFKSESYKDKFKSRYIKKKNASAFEKLLFKKLIQLGLKATTALKVSKLSASGNREMVISEINAVKYLDSQKKKAILRLCSGAL